jgi:tetratricopeptide (TPR) repeat protein
MGTHDRVDELRRLLEQLRLSQCPDCGRWNDPLDQQAARFATTALYQALAARRELDELRSAADTGDTEAAKHLARGLTKHGSVKELRTRASSGDRYASFAVAYQPDATEDDLDHAIAVHRPLADTGDESAIEALAHLLDARGDTEGAIAQLRRLSEQYREYEALLGSGYAHDLVDMLVDVGRVDEAIQLLLERVDTGSWFAVRHLVTLAAEHGRTDVLYDLALRRYGFAVEHLAHTLDRTNRVAELQAESSAGNKYATRHLIRRARAGTVDPTADLRRWTNNVALA